MDNLLNLLAAAAAALGLAFFWGHRRGRARALLQDHTPSSEPVAAQQSPPAPAEPQPAHDVYKLASELADFYHETAHPQDLIDHSAAFRSGVAQLTGADTSVDMLKSLATGDNSILSCMALAAMAEREDCNAAREPILNYVGTIAQWPLYFALRFLAKATPPHEPVLLTVLCATVDYLDYRLARLFLLDFINSRLAGGEAPAAPAARELPAPDKCNAIRKLIHESEHERKSELLDAFDAWHAKHVDLTLLRSVGKVWDAHDAGQADTLISHQRLAQAVDTLQRSLLAKEPQSALIIGEPGVGKSTIIQRLAKNLFDDGWTIFVCGHAELIAGQVYIGQFEGRLKHLIEQLRGGRRILWIIPGFQALALSGRHKYSSVSALDMILPLAETGELKILGEITPAALERMLQEKPMLASALAALRVEPLSENDTKDVAGRWLHQVTGNSSPQVIDQAWELAQQYLSDRAAPGNLLSLLQMSVAARQALHRSASTIGIDDVITTLSRQTGLPLEILDHRSALDLDHLRQVLSTRVVGQDEAVECLVERVALMKAGLNDPSRPVGVFLFAGPTGTGKTEIAKTLAGWLFGDPQRLLRIDMSELQTFESLDRLLGSSADERSQSLVDLIRKQPYSVLLLDEFEKAHPRVWDVFLQVFDDARMSDRKGQTASFRHAIIILTSNLGATIPTGVALGFGTKSLGLDPDEISRAIAQTFRREFINRLDRVVVFRPLNRESMRQILHNELNLAFRRRGVKDRTWAVEWDEAAIDFLLDKGFTPDLGARPLKRAIETYLLAPLAMTIVHHQAPEGDQFLFVTSRNDKLQVSFVDPDAPEEHAEAADLAAHSPPQGRALRDIILDPRATMDDVALLREHYDALSPLAAAPQWSKRKEQAMAAMQDPAFWSQPSRFAILGLAEYIDRVEAGIDRAGSLLLRLEGFRQRSAKAPPAHLIGTLAQNIFLLTTACADVEQERPRDAFLLVEASKDGTSDWTASAAFAQRLAHMYRSWAKTRGMQLRQLESSATDARYVFAVTGYGSYSLLQNERGLHVLEQPSSRPRQFDRANVHVQVVAQDDAPPDDTQAALLQRARTALQAGSDGQHTIARRYREEPQPLVRDSVRGWRTGRLDQVLAGNFDLM